MKTSIPTNDKKAGGKCQGWLIEAFVYIMSIQELSVIAQMKLYALIKLPRVG